MRRQLARAARRARPETQEGLESVVGIALLMVSVLAIVLLFPGK